jgi:perosamine synthetase
MNKTLAPIPVAKPVLDEREVAAARRVVLSGWVTQGPEVAQFEQEFAELVGASHACAVSNCTTALHLALRAVGVKAGDEVITVTHSFIASANAIRHCGAIPVFVDIEAEGYNIDCELIEGAITRKTKAILCVHQLGMPCDIHGVLKVAAAHSVPVVEDAACATGSEILWAGRWERIGRPRAEVACFSFHPRKVVTTGDGGMLTTANADHDRNFRLWRQHGMSVSDTVRHGSRRIIYETYPELGYNYRMTDLQAAIGREQLGRLPEIIRRRRQLAERYRERLRSIPGIGVPAEPSWARSNWQSYCVRLPLQADQRSVMQALLDRNVASRRGVMNSHLEDAYAEPESCRIASSLRRSVEAQARSIILPLFVQMSDEEIDFVADTLANVLDFSDSKTGAMV